MKNAVNRIARALPVDYVSVYVINLNTNAYEGYTTNQGYQNLKLDSSGSDFFADCRKDIQKVVYEEDREALLKALTKEAIRDYAENSKEFPVVYRLMIDGNPVYHTMRLIHDDQGTEEYVILGVLNIDRQVRTETATRTYNAIARTLANMYATIYYVNLETEHYIEYSSTDAYKDLEVPPEGMEFFAESRKNIRRVIHPDDMQKVVAAFDRETMLKNIREQGVYRLSYRLMLNGVANHVSLMAVLDEDEKHMVVAVSNIEKEVRREEELKEVSKKNVIFSQIATSLASQYGMIYYIDTETDHYMEFTAQNAYKELNVSPEGDDFFGTSQRNVSLIVVPEDREMVFNALAKDNIITQVNEKGRYTLTYRLLLNTGSSYTRMSVVWANDRKHLIMGVMNIDSEMERENALRQAVIENQVFGQIAESLAAQYDTIYYVDALNDSYTEFSSTDVYKNLGIQPHGDSFFEISKENCRRVVYEEDQEEFLRVIDKANLVGMLSGKHMITHTYRLKIGDGIMYARMSVIWAKDNKHLIIGVMNIDEEVRREQEVKEILTIANEKAYRDELTGIKNKNAFTELEMQVQEQIRDGIAEAFAMVVCDVNGLKDVNDRLGHKAGDRYIQDACDLICNIWQHSPVFRIGGDEFVVFPQGEDYGNREALLEKLLRQSRENEQTGNVIVAAGMSTFDRKQDLSFSSVFVRADEEMYKMKIQLKGARI